MQKRSAAALLAKRLGGDVCEASRQLGMHRSFVQRWYQRYISHGSLEDKARCGRPSTAISATALARGRNLVMTPGFSTMKLAMNQLKSEGLVDAKTHPRTLCRHLQKGPNALMYGAPKQTPRLTIQQKANRVAFAAARRPYGWHTVLFTDSKYFTLNQAAKGKRWMPLGERIQIRVDKYPSKVHVYGGISNLGKLSLIFVTGTTGLKKTYAKQQGGTYSGVSAEEYTDMILKKVLPQARKMFVRGTWHLLQDGAPAHRAASTKKALARAKVRLVEKWPGNSPDLNPIENIWSWMVRWISKHAHCTTCEELKQAVLDAWEALPMSVIRSNIDSMQERLRICMEREGDYTGY